MNKKHIAIFASGSGSNAENISRFFMNHPIIEISLILTNKPDAQVLERAKRLGIPYYIFNREEFYSSGSVIDVLKSYKIDFIVLAGFLWLIPEVLIKCFPQKIINIHPALLPKYGGKGMYGSKVHQSVIENHEKESGITIHFVNGEYDAGDIIFQAKCSVEHGETPESLAEKVHELEYEHFPRVIGERLMC
ncbi:MAG: phosphoribosylglycinamide formyltransferase [Bacteroidales bacterium]|nr:phosphoribosylglycinamide formyltransferase [Bacteroidales bacterium]